GRLDEAGIAEGLLHLRHHPFQLLHFVAHKVGEANLGNALLGKHLFHHDLVHPHRRRENPRPHIGNLGQFQQPLNRAVFPVRSVKHGEHHVDLLEVQGSQRFFLHQGRRRGRSIFLNRFQQSPFHLAFQKGGGLIPQLPLSLLVDGDRQHFVFFGVHRTNEGGRRHQRHLVFPRFPAEQHSDAQLSFHSHPTFPIPVIRKRVSFHNIFNVCPGGNRVNRIPRPDRHNAPRQKNIARSRRSERDKPSLNSTASLYTAPGSRSRTNQSHSRMARHNSSFP